MSLPLVFFFFLLPIFSSFFLSFGIAGSHLVGLNGGNFLVTLDEVTNLCVAKLVCYRARGHKKNGSIRFENCFRVPSVIDSAMLGTLTIESAGRHERLKIEFAGVAQTIGADLVASQRGEVESRNIANHISFGLRQGESNAYLEACSSPEALVRVRVDRPFTLRSWEEARGVVLATAERRWAERRAMEILEAMM